MESWRKVFRVGFAPLMSHAALAALRDALRDDDRKLVQGCATIPPPLACVQDWPVEAACPIGFAGWQGDGLTTVGETEEYFARLCFEADQALGGPAGCRWILNWADETPRDEMRRLLLPEVQAELTRREERAE